MPPNMLDNNVEFQLNYSNQVLDSMAENNGIWSDEPTDL